eukprot:TRINITY_DN40395_c0_g1_i1.p1 TRINITY_DN40395_c0_g1~~TRINITY_DN40395_c0_g1_i1.p1  ORF type:complete len:246 (-),score=83.70 TRINITY_DN40395_c0_g1_i1:111-848(-)
MARMLNIRYPHARVVGVEFQPLVRDLARKLTAATEELQGGGVEFWEPGDPNSDADIHSFLKQAPDESFDGVVSFLAILHIPQKDQLFKELFRVLKPAGRILFEDLISTAAPERLTKQLSCDSEQLRYAADVPRALDLCGSVVESKLSKLQRVVYFQDALTLASYESMLKEAGFMAMPHGAVMACDATQVWSKYVKDRSDAFHSYTAQTPLTELGVPREGTLGEALQTPGVYGLSLIHISEPTRPY